jgi:alpha-tubulin suppressor-like RCC1 family protein
MHPRPIGLVGALVLIMTLPAAANGDAVYAWGNDGYGQLGDGSTGIRLSPVLVPSLSGDVSVVAAGADFGFAVRGGAAYAWGHDQFGQLGDGRIEVAPVPSPVPISNLADGVTAVTGGNYHAVAILNGAVYSWGFNGYGQLGTGSTSDSVVPLPVLPLSSGVTAVAAGEGGGNGTYYSMALRNGAVYSWGYNGFGQLGDGTTIDRHAPVPVPQMGDRVTVIAAGGYQALAVRNGAVYAWGYNGYGQLGDGTTADRDSPAPVMALTSGVTAVASGAYHCLAVRDGQVWAWGQNQYGQIGDGTTADRHVPIPVAGLSSITAVAAGLYSSYALADDGSLWVWGLNDYGQLGLGDMDPRTTPTHLLPPSGYRFTGIAAEEDAALATVAQVPEPAAGILLCVVFVATGGRANCRRLPCTCESLV